MGQYYRVAVKTADGNVRVSGRRVEGVDYVMAKLMEHSWLGNSLMDAVCYAIERGEVKRVAWVGDYADERNGDGEGEVEEATAGEVSFDAVWADEADDGYKFTRPKGNRFRYKGKYLVNDTKKIFISFDKLVAAAKDPKWVIHPLSLLTAIGNGRGGGDYSGLNEDLVGLWAWNDLRITSEPPKGYDEKDWHFEED